jgi:sulfhydrogenase subunit beta (sulfur reductase)
LKNQVYWKIRREDLGEFYKGLNSYGTIFAPKRIGKKTHSFTKVDGLDEIDFKYTRTMIPPKKFFIDTEEVILSFNEEDWSFSEPEQIASKSVIFGVHACDIYALNLLDRIFIDDKPDIYYSERREKSMIVGLSCTPDEYCFCASTGTGYALEGFDIFLHEIDDGYIVRVGSLKGFSFLEKNSEIFQEPDRQDIINFQEREDERQKSFQRELNINGLQDFLDLAYDSQIWKEYADECLGCGTCNLVCPRCRCYEVTDNLNLDIQSGDKIRSWSSCMLNKHGLVAGGHNFRPTRAERLRNRFNCKGSRREGLQNCVGCGRCTVYCPVDIDYVEVQRRVRSEI